ncbi:MAG: maleylpyruvate isomerase family mycothiol-dependent enzyme [Pseudonocardiaceae bacterium]
MSRPERDLAWVADAQALFEQTVMELADLRVPSRLPGWTRGHVVTHVARNAEGLGRLLTWARTGIETPMYPSVQQRDADIEAGSGRGRTEQLDDLRRAAAAFAAAAGELSSTDWEATVRTRHGSLPASAVPWVRVRELWLHLVDLDAMGLGAAVEIDSIPEDIATALVRDLASWMHTRVSTRVVLQLPGGTQTSFGPEDSVPVEVSGPVRELAGWLTGRCGGQALNAPDGLPELPSWL